MLLISQSDESGFRRPALHARQRAKSAARPYPANPTTALAKAFVLVERTGIAALGILAICSGSAAHADSRGDLGATSKASIGISVSVRPQIHFKAAQAHAAAKSIGGVADTGKGLICLKTNIPETRFAVSMETVDEDSSNQKMSSAVVIDAAARVSCALASADQGQAVAVVLAPAAAAPSGLVRLMISPD